MKKLFLSLIITSVFSIISYYAKTLPTKSAELVTRPDGSQYIQCINPGDNCAV